ncbi:TrbG/VirB9 family P-type conjugative transfer protein [Paraburkholderia fungorum]|uniref:TrbG/VirB9 family P-type conjugative transfer protein n=1 Tax=Paraburkholderia fungorum TaxID=134537 RepID=UPI0016192A6E|nr:TrbG/VirB9 family P-type conjugative transfer protein [Paraburkholderia fungorum]MBB5546608.1 hypothetical protein [Paraburkholderia fungorum]
MTVKKLTIAMLLTGAFSAGAYAADSAEADGGAMLAESVVHVGPGVVLSTKCVVPGEITSTDAGMVYCEAKSHTWQLWNVSHADDANSSSSDYHVYVPPPPRFVPTKVWDDGKFTYIQLRAPYNGDLPAVFSETDDGKFALLNAKWDEKSARFVIPNLIDRVIMRVGAKSVEIDRATAGQPVVIKDTRTGTGFFDGVPASGVLVTRASGICDESAHKRTTDNMPMPVVEHRSFPCDAAGNQIVSN